MPRSGIFGCCVKKVEDVKQLDLRHCGLNQLPKVVFNAERTLEVLHIDSNQISILPRELFHCHGLHTLTLSDNDVTSLPAAVSKLTSISTLDISKNGILELPEEVKLLKYLSTLDASVNPLGKLPDGFTQLSNLTQLSLNDCFLEYLPGTLGRLSRLRSLELRENHLKTLPQSLSRLSHLERFDIGCNELTELPGVILASLVSLLELWCDSNQLKTIPKEVGCLKQLLYLDACKNRISELPSEIDGCVCLSDLYLSTNLLKTLPQTIGRLSNMTTLKVDDNQLQVIPSSIGGMISLSELDISANDLEELPPTLGLLRHLRTLIADENFLSDIPPELGSCSALTVLSVRSNKLTYLPDEIGRISRLRVLTLSDNEIKALPYSLMNLKELQALWLAENQSKALIRLQSTIDPHTRRKILTCYLLPQRRLVPVDSYEDEGSDDQSFHASVWEETRQQRQTIQFADTKSASSPRPSKTRQHRSQQQGELEEIHVYPKERRVDARHRKNEVKLKTVSTSSLTAATKDENDLWEKNSSHRLHKLDKEKQAKDRERLNRLSHPATFSDGANNSDIVVLPRHQRPVSSPSSIHSHKSSSIPGKEKRSGRHSTDNEQYMVIPGNGLNSSNTNLQSSQLNPATTHSQHSLASYTPNTTAISDNSISAGHYPTNNVPSTTTATTSPNLTAGNKPVDATAAEDTFGVFASDEDPKLYERRFKYYQRLRKQRKQSDVQSDLGGGFYKSQYSASNVGGGRAASDSGRHYSKRHNDRRDAYLYGNNAWRQHGGQRGMADGYASDLDIYKHRSNVPPSQLAGGHGSKLGGRNKTVGVHTSLGSLSTNRPSAPPSYDTAVAKRTPELKHRSNALQNSQFPPPPPYKAPTTRDEDARRPDGASNDGNSRSSPSTRLIEDGGLVDSSQQVDNYMTETSAYQSVSAAHDSGAAASRTADHNTTELSMTQYRHVNSNPSLNTQTNNLSQGPNTKSNLNSINIHSNYMSPSSISTPYESRPQSQQTANVTAASTTTPTPNYYRPHRSPYTPAHSQPIREVTAENTPSTDALPPPALFRGADITASGASNQKQRVQSAEIKMDDIMFSPANRNSIPSFASGPNSSNYSYLPPPSRKSPKLAHKSIYANPPTGLSIEEMGSSHVHAPLEATSTSTQEESGANIYRTVIEVYKNPGLGFSVAGGIGLQGNPYRPLDEGIFVTKVSADGAAAELLMPGDKILSVDGQDLTHREHNEAVSLLKSSQRQVTLAIERVLPTNV